MEINESADKPDMEKVIEEFIKKDESKEQIQAIYNKIDYKFKIQLDDVYAHDQTLLKELLDTPDQIEEFFKDSVEDSLYKLSQSKFEFKFVFDSINFGEIELNKIHKKSLGSMIVVKDCVINGITEIFIKYEFIAYMCPVCQTMIELEQNMVGEQLIPKICFNPGCKNKRGFTIVQKDSTKTIIQFAWISKNNSKMKILIPNYLTNKFKPGDIIRIVGFVSTERRNKSFKLNTFRSLILINNMIKTDSIEFQEILNDYNRIYLNPKKGVFLDIVTENELITERLLTFNKLEILNRYTVQSGPIRPYRFDGFISMGNQSKIFFYNADIDTLKTTLQQNCAVSSKHIKQITVALQKYLDTFPDKSDQVSEIIGFVENGWKLHSNCIILIQDFTSNKIIDNFKTIELDNPDIPKLKKDFIDFYNKTGIFHKGIILAWVLASPFLYMFRKLRSIMPILALQGTGNTGKTTYLETLINTGFGHINLFTAQSINSSSRLESILASSTLPIFIDDVTNVKPEFVDTIKSYLTGDARFQRKGAGIGRQFLTIDKPLCAPTTLTCNDPPYWFADNYFLERVFLDIISSMVVKPGWFDARDKLEKGCLLALLYSHTKKWELKDLKSKLEKIKIPKKLLKEENRVQNIYLVFALGAKFAKEIFNIDIDISEVGMILKRTRLLNLDTMAAIMNYQINNGQPVRFCNEILCIDELRVPKDAWIKTCLLSGSYVDMSIVDDQGGGQIVDCWVWNINNIRELQQHLEGFSSKRWTLQTFFVKIQKTFPNVQIGRFKVDFLIQGVIKRKLARSVIIPKADFIMMNESVK